MGLTWHYLTDNSKKRNKLKHQFQLRRCDITSDNSWLVGFSSSLNDSKDVVSTAPGPAHIQPELLGLIGQL